MLKGTWRSVCTELPGRDKSPNPFQSHTWQSQAGLGLKRLSSVWALESEVISDPFPELQPKSGSHSKDRGAVGNPEAMGCLAWLD